MNDKPALPSFTEALAYWFKLGCVSFGGPAGQIAMMQRELVEKRRWISDGHFMHALNFCMLLPGPEAQQLATYLGWRMHGWKGGVAAGALFVIPSMFVLFALSWLYMVSGQSAVFYGLMAAVVAVVAEAVFRLGKKSLKSESLFGVAVASFVAIYFYDVSFIWIVVAAGILGWLGNKHLPTQFPAGAAHGSGGKQEDGKAFVELPACPQPSWRRSRLVFAVCLVLWWAPILLVGAWLGWRSTAFQQGVFFSQAALVTFGGAYAVLPYVAQHAVERFAWLSHTQMMSGLGLAETTPGPLIMVLQFVGFVAGWQHAPEGFSPLMGALIGSLVTTWATFLPCFLFVFLGAPHVEQLQRYPQLSAALTAITAAVVGVILNLGVDFCKAALWPAPSHQFDFFLALLALAAFVALKFFKIGFVPVLGVCAALGTLWKWYC